MLAAQAIGGAALLAFAAFLFHGPVRFVRLASTVPGALAIDAALSLAFFVQHSGMVRRSARNWLGRFTPEHFAGALYAIASGAALLALIVLWQPTDHVLASAGEPYRSILRGIFVAALAGFLWVARALGSFDPFGAEPIRARLAGRRSSEAPALTIRGPYRWVRHPIYTLSLVLIWSHPAPTADRLLLDTMWTGWIFVGAALEERDLLAVFGPAYREYRQRVPMLIPLRRPRGGPT